MSRKNKIIVSVVGIFIILLAMLGITYGYFLTRITGNTKDNSILITTANLRLVYDDGTGEINVSNIHPGDTVYTKTFTVANEGNSEVGYEVHLENVINKFEHDEDLMFKIVCESNIDGNSCNGYDSTYPLSNVKLITNKIAPVSETNEREIHTYTVSLQFKDDGTDQSNDMGKILQGKFNIYDPNDIVSLTGTVTNAQSNYYVEVQSTPVVSQIINGKYFINGVTPGNHTLYIKYKDNNNEEVVVASKQIVISKLSESGEASESNGVVTIPVSTLSESVTLPISIETDEDDSTRKVLKLNNIVINDKIEYVDYDSNLSASISMASNVLVGLEEEVENVDLSESVYSSFVITNNSDVLVPFNISLSSKLGSVDGKKNVEYVHSTLSGEDLINSCYVSSAYLDGDNSLPNICYNGDFYNNIEVELYRYYDYLYGKEAFLSTDWKSSFSTIPSESLLPITTDSSGNLISYKAPYYNSIESFGNSILLKQQNGTIMETVESGKSNYYIMKITYLSSEGDRGIEKGAKVLFYTSISNG